MFILLVEYDLVDPSACCGRASE